MADTEVTSLRKLDENEQVTLDMIAPGLSDAEVDRLLAEPSTPSPIPSFTTTASIPVTPAQTRTRSATRAKTPVPLQGTKETKMATSRSFRSPKPAKHVVPTGWTAVNSRNAESVTAYAAEHRITPSGTQQLAASLLEQNFLSQVELFDLTDQFHTVDPASGIKYADFLIGAVACRTGNNTIQRGFRFNPDAKQVVLLARGTIYTELQEPEPTTGLMQGPAPAIFVCFPETIPKVPARRETNNVPLEGYRPLLRLMGQHIEDGYDGEDEVRAVTNVFFQVRTRGVGRFNDLIPNGTYKCALKAGLTDADLLIRVTNTAEIERRSLQRQRSNRNRAGYSTPVNQGTGRPLAGMQDTTRDPANGLRNSIGQAFSPVT